MRVAGNRQQRVEKERDQRRPHANRPGDGNEKREQRERRDGLQQAGKNQHRLRYPGVLRGDQAERYADQSSDGERREHKPQVLKEEATEVGGEQGAPKTFRLFYFGP